MFLMKYVNFQEIISCNIFLKYDWRRFVPIRITKVSGPGGVCVCQVNIEGWVTGFLHVQGDDLNMCEQYFHFLQVDYLLCIMYEL